ncbi:MAG TPA: TolC family protein [Xanthomonadales bacterium]|nr:TolC family protein [Xanthomonadales bacterium]
MRYLIPFVASMVWLAPVKVFAQGEADILRPESVLEASAEHFPEILKGMALQRGAEAGVLEAQGAFDLVFDGEGFSRVDGFYDGTAVAGKARQRFRNYGGEYYAGYKISNGTFPIYEDIWYTNTGGTLSVGALFALLRDREIDDDRYAATDARLAKRQADLDLLLTRIGVQQRALMAYWDWVAVGRKLAVYEDLLLIATQRQVGLTEEVRRGARAEFFLTENQQNITRRQTLVTVSRRDFMIAANNLGFYFRDGQGRPQQPSQAQLPPVRPVTAWNEPGELPITTAGEALDRRPELARLRNTIDRVRNEIQLVENDLKPRLDFGVEMQQGLGAVAEGGPSRDSFDAILAMKFSVPFQQRETRGRLLRAEAELEAKQQEKRLQQERIELQVRNILLELAFARQLLQLAAAEAQQSAVIRDAEIKRFQSGASDFFLVNVREETAANARVKFHDAELTTRIARATYDAAVVDYERLGLGHLVTGAMGR